MLRARADRSQERSQNLHFQSGRSFQYPQSRLLISGIRRDPLAEHGWEHYSMEIPYSRFTCSVTLPHDLEEAGLQTEYLDGMLLIRVRFAEEDR